ncbi:MAG TPA: oligosaccharide flippase family protein [Patescibacteria group bacterium]|nr:oligosaccharide flippase family protein [Patescibacteria group bacterium]
MSPFNHKLLSNICVIGSGFVLRLGAQVVLFLIITRGLGASDYGIFVSVTALMSVASCFVGWGCDQIFIQHVAPQQERFRDFLGHGLIAIVVTAPVAAAICLILLPNIKGTGGVGFPVFVMLALADLFFGRLNSFCAAAYIAIERAVRLSLLNIGFTSIRLAAAVLAMLINGHLDIQTWACWYLVSSTLAGLGSFALVVHDQGWPRWFIARGEIASGFQFCIQTVSGAAVRDIDKPILASIVAPEAAGIYAAAGRFVDTLTIPIRALLYSTYSRFIRHGHVAASDSLSFGLRLLPFALGYAALAGVALSLGARFVPLILGAQYAKASEVLPALAALPFLTAAASIGGDILTSTGQQKARAVIVVVASLSTVVLCPLAIPAFGIFGAVLVSIASNAILALANWSWVFCTVRRAAPDPAPEDNRAIPHDAIKVSVD